MEYDYVIRNGRVIDPAAGVDEAADVYICGNRIAEPPAGPAGEAKTVIDASGCLVLPGLIDFHTHLGYQLSDFGLNPDLYTLPNGITAAVDAGSGGTANFEGMYQNVFSKAMITIRCFLNVAATGIITERYTENLEPERFDEKKMELLFDRYQDVLLGFKVRVGRNTSGDLRLRPLERAVELAERFHCRVCLHATNLEDGYDEIFRMMRKGDIVCHIFQGDNGHTILNSRGDVSDVVYAAREKGILLDCACGRVNYSNRVMRASFAEGFWPDIVSTDIIGFSIYGPKIHSLLSVMSQYYGMGMPLPDLIRAVTTIPAEVMGLRGEAGTLRPGAKADVFVAEIQKNRLDITDKFGETVSLDETIVPMLTFKEGRLAYRNILFDPYC
ncbi:amidohydrolase family protein [uncultured Oscillibacter sp.]|uniref:amidohydrolase family protein n=1 Tax=uncultured Oscillibacter sp. TaxID=876091 RepID=UPI0026054648|nr:amidohydrolase family protein [uncultured Oscillibacter sp.]